MHSAFLATLRCPDHKRTHMYCSETPALLLFRRQALDQHPWLFGVSTCNALPCPTYKHPGNCSRETHVLLTASKVWSPPYATENVCRSPSPPPEKIGLAHIFQIRSSVRHVMIFFGPPGPAAQAETLNLKLTNALIQPTKKSSPGKLGISSPERPICRATLFLRTLCCLT